MVCDGVNFRVVVRGDKSEQSRNRIWPGETIHLVSTRERIDNEWSPITVIDSVCGDDRARSEYKCYIPPGGAGKSIQSTPLSIK